MGFVSAGCTAQRVMLLRNPLPPLLFHVKAAVTTAERRLLRLPPPRPHPASPRLLRSDAACRVQLAVMTISVWRRLQEITGDLRPHASAQPERNGRLLLISHAAILGTLLH